MKTAPHTTKPGRAIKLAVGHKSNNRGAIIRVLNAMPLWHPAQRKRHVNIDRLLGSLPKPELERILREVRA